MRSLKYKHWSGRGQLCESAFWMTVDWEPQGCGRPAETPLLAVAVLSEKFHVKGWKGTESFYGYYSTQAKSHSHFFWNQFQVAVMSLFPGVCHLKISHCSIFFVFRLTWDKGTTSTLVHVWVAQKAEISCLQPLYCILLFPALSSPFVFILYVSA